LEKNFAYFYKPFTNRQIKSLALKTFCFQERKEKKAFEQNNRDV
jgi:hypothetical protein